MTNDAARDEALLLDPIRAHAVAAAFNRWLTSQDLWDLKRATAAAALWREGRETAGLPLDHE